MNDSLIKDIGRSYIVSSLLPASFFSLLAAFIFRDFLPPFTDITSKNQTVVFSNGVLMLAFSMWLAFMLYSSVDFIFKLFEGYYYPFFVKIPLQYFQYRLQRWRLRDYYKFVEKSKVAVSDNNSTSFINGDQLSTLEKKAKHQLLTHEISAPIEGNWRSYLPTALGNILLASELYPYEKYKLNGAMFFPRMSMLFPSKFAAALEEKNNQVVFILNSSLLSHGIGLFGLLAGGMGWLNGTNWGNQWMGWLLSVQKYLQPGFCHISPKEYFLLGILFWVLGYIIYRTSISTVREYAMFIRTSFDLYRFKALRELNHPVPLSLAEEKLVWEAISEYLVSGDRFGEMDFRYQLKKDLDPHIPEKKKKWWLFSL